MTAAKGEIGWALLYRLCVTRLAKCGNEADRAVNTTEKSGLSRFLGNGRVQSGTCHTRGRSGTEAAERQAGGLGDGFEDGPQRSDVAVVANRFSRA